MSPSLRRKGSQQGSFTLSYPGDALTGVVRAEENCYSSGAAARTFCLIHFEKPLFTFRLMGAIDNVTICPIAFNGYEELKTKLAWPKGRRDLRR